MRGLIYSILLFFALLATACDSPHEVVVEQGSGTLVVTIAPAEIIGVEETRGELGDGNVADGGGMQDITLILVDPHNIVVNKKQLTYDGVAWNGAEISASEGNKQITTAFEGLDIANYDIYAYANVQGRTDIYSSIAEQLAAVEINSEFTLADVTLPQLTGIATPEKSDTMPMLLTASKRIPISIGSTSTVVELQRIMAYVELIVVNNSSKKLNINSLKFKNINPATAYITPHDEILASGVGNTYRSLPDFVGPVDVDAISEKRVYGTYLLESSGDKSLYAFDINIGIDATTSSSVTKYVGLTKHTGTFANGAIYALGYTYGGTEYYLADDGDGNLVALTELNDDNFMRAEWYLYSNDDGSNGYLQNVATNNIYYGDTKKNSGNKLFFAHDTSNNGKYFISSDVKVGSTTQVRYLQYYNNKIQYYSWISSSTSWQLYTVQTKPGTDDDALFEPKQITEQISVIDGAGIAKPMTEIRRNSHISIVLNVYYDEVTGGFKFEVKPWERVNVDWTFK